MVAVEAAAIHHNGESTAGVRVERTFSLPISTRIVVSGIEPDVMPCSSMLSPVVPGLFPVVTPNRRDGESLHSVVRAWLAHSGYPVGLGILSRKSPGPLTAHVPYADELKIIINCE